jgi:AcrR family transcriptional regulator
MTRPRPRSPKQPPSSWHGTGTQPVGAVAQATGVARGTIYRYFPTRQALLTAVVDQALRKAERQLAQANLAAVPVAEGLARAVRALVALGDDFLVVVRQRLLSGGDIPAFSAVVALLERGRQGGDLRSDLPLSCQVEALYALVQACLRARELPPRDQRTSARPRCGCSWRDPSHRLPALHAKPAARSLSWVQRPGPCPSGAEREDSWPQALDQGQAERPSTCSFREPRLPIGAACKRLD